MKGDLSVTLRGVRDSSTLQNVITHRHDKLARLVGKPFRCAIALERPHRSHHKGQEVRVRVELHGLDRPVIVSREMRDRPLSAVVLSAFEAAERIVRERRHPHLYDKRWRAAA